MSLGLLGQYGSVESSSEVSDSDEEQPATRNDRDTTAPGVSRESSLPADRGRSPPSGGCCDPLQLCGVAGGKHSSTDPLSLAGDSESDSTSEEEEEEDSSEEYKPQVEEPHVSLPLPDLDQTSSSSHSVSSVFSNPFREAEKAKMAILNQHVDFDNPKTRQPKSKLRHTAHPTKKHSSQRHKRFRHSDADREDLSPGDLLFDESDSSLLTRQSEGGGKRRRAGVGNALEPSKQVMRHHKDIQARERPWTLQQ